MTYLGTTGAYESSWDDNDPRPLFERVAKKASDANDFEDIAHAFFLKANAAQLRVLQTAALRNMHTAWLRKRPKTRAEERAREAAKKVSEAARARTVSELVDKVETKIKAEATRQLLDMMIEPYGRPMRECTCSEMTKLGGYYAKIGALGKPNQKVSEVCSELKARALAPKGLV